MTPKPERNSMILLFTYGMSLGVWEEQGIMGRETRYYRVLQDRSSRTVKLMTYGTKDIRFHEVLSPLVVLSKPRWCNDLVYSIIAPFIHWSQFRSADIVKSNQSRGAWTGLVAKLFSPRKLFIVRCGWVLTDEIMTKHKRFSRLKVLRTKAIEKLTFRSADAVFVTTSTDKEYVASAYGVQPEKINILPNAVDMEIFSPPAPKRTWGAEVKVILVGRLVKMKNFQSVISAVNGLDRCNEIVIVGDGEYKESLQELAAKEGVNVRFLSFIQNEEVATLLQEAHIFVIPQTYGSGMSKVMLEAMACGLITIASDIQAHRDVLTDGVNGFLCGFDPASVRSCLVRVLSMSSDALEGISGRARQDIERKYSMRSIAKQELEILTSLNHHE